MKCLIIVLISLMSLEAKAESHHSLSKQLINDSFRAAAIANHVPLSLLRAVCWVESNHNPNAKKILDARNPLKGKNSYGMCQVQIDTARKNGYHGDVKGLMYPPTNAFIAAMEIKRWLRVSHGNWRHAVASYNAGHYRRVLINEYIAKVSFAKFERR